MWLYKGKLPETKVSPRVQAINEKTMLKSLVLAMAEKGVYLSLHDTVLLKVMTKTVKEQTVCEHLSKMFGCLLPKVSFLLLLPLGLALERRTGRAQRGVTLLGRNVGEARITLELAMGMERELRKAVRSLEQRLQGMEKSIEGLARVQEEDGEDGEEQGEVAEEQEEVWEGSLRHLRHSGGGRKHKPFSPWAGR